MARIVISYRRDDTEAMTGRIYDCLVDHYGEDTVYRDLESIPVGKDYRVDVNEAVRSADLLLVIIGQRWTGLRHNTVRIKEAGDAVRSEIKAAMDYGVPMIPVLVDDAIMPRAHDLPADIKNFAYNNAATVDAGKDFRVHMERLFGHIDEVLEGPHSSLGNPGKWVRAFQKPRFFVPAAFLVAAVGTFWFWPTLSFWKIDGLTFYQVDSGTLRQLFYYQPETELKRLGIAPHVLFFEGRRSGDFYKGEIYEYCRQARLAYCGQGKLINERHVKLKGNAPLLDCTETGKQEKTVDITYDGRRRVLLAPWYRYRLRHSESALEQCVPK